MIGELPVRDVDTGLVLRILEPIWSKKPETASRVRGRIERILDAAASVFARRGFNEARMGDVATEAGVNIQNITTSEIRISCIIAKPDAEKALKAVHAAFDLAKR